MKISNITESGMTRRNFLANTGRSMLGVLVSSGISLDIAKDIVIRAASSDKFGISKFVQGSDGAFYDDAHESANKIWGGLSAFRREFGLKPALVFGPDQIGAGGIVSGGELVKFFAKVSADGWEIVPEDENNWLLVKGSEEIFVSNEIQNDDWSFGDFSSYSEFLNKWWAGWMRSSFESSTLEFRRILAKNGIDYWDRPEHVIEQAMESLGDLGPEEFDKLYGDVDEWLELADSKGILRPKSETPVEKFEPRRDDHVYGSSMHQPFESKLKMALDIF